MSKYREGDKVIYIPEGKVYDFGWYTATGCCICIEGERGMQSSYAVKLTDIKMKKDESY